MDKKKIGIAGGFAAVIAICAAVFGGKKDDTTEPVATVETTATAESTATPARQKHPPQRLNPLPHRNLQLLLCPL